MSVNGIPNPSSIPPQAPIQSSVKSESKERDPPGRSDRREGALSRMVMSSIVFLVAAAIAVIPELLALPAHGARHVLAEGAANGRG